MSNVTETPDPTQTPAANRFTPDAQERMLRLRGCAADFPNEADPQPLKTSEIRLARGTSLAALEKAAVLAEVAPMFGITTEDLATLRETIAFELAYGSVRDEARAYAHQVDMAIIRRKIKATKIARAIYGASKGFLGLAAGDPLKTHVGDMKRALNRPHRRKAAGEAEKK